MTDAPPLDERSARSRAPAGVDFESFYLAHRVRVFRALVVVTREVHRRRGVGAALVRQDLGAVGPGRADAGPGGLSVPDRAERMVPCLAADRAGPPVRPGGAGAGDRTRARSRPRREWLLL